MERGFDKMIPKIIHYCWFGGKPLDALGKKCLRSWKKHFPDYEIIRWDESNVDLTGCQYAREAYAEKKWAFVSDYVRYKVLYEQGGIYFDTDVEVLRSFDDILEKGSFMGCEYQGLNVYLKKGPYGFYVQLGEDATATTEKPKRIALPKLLNPEDVTYEHAETLVSLPKDIGNGITVNIGKFGPYIKHNGKYCCHNQGTFHSQ